MTTNIRIQPESSNPRPNKRFRKRWLAIPEVDIWPKVLCDRARTEELVRYSAELASAGPVI